MSRKPKKMRTLDDVMKDLSPSERARVEAKARRLTKEVLELDLSGRLAVPARPRNGARARRA